MLYVVRFYGVDGESAGAPAPVRGDWPDEASAVLDERVQEAVRGGWVPDINRNPKGRHDGAQLACGCQRRVQRARGGRTVTEDRLPEPVCSGCGAQN